MANVPVKAASANIPGVHSTTTESDGQYRLLNLPPGLFNVTAESAGFSKTVRTNIEVRAGLNLTVDIEMKLGAVEQTVNVSGDAPLLETEKAVQAVNVASDFQRELPLSTRHDLTDSLEVTPGVAARTFISNNGTQDYMLRGTDVEQHVVLIDGADMGSSRQGRTDFVQAVKVIAEDSREFTLLTRDLSPTGLRLIGTRHLLGQKVHVLIPAPEGGHLDFVVRILWTCPVGTDLIENGGTFVSVGK